MEPLRLAPSDLGFPKDALRAIPPPRALWIRGTLPRMPAVAVVGTRRMSWYGRRAVELLVPELVRHGYAIASGLALGIDAVAHETALKCGGSTFAVIGSGLDRASVFPPAHAELADRIVASGGAVLSEYAPGAPALKHHFPARNRLIAALSQAVLVVEAPFKSGAMITARLALELGKSVWAVPNPITSELGVGPNRLIRDGACPVATPDDLRFALGLPEERDLPAEDRLAALAADLRPAAACLLKEPLTADELARRLGVDASQAAGLLIRLEISGRLLRLDGGRYTLYT